MKKLLALCFIALTVSTNAGAFSLPKADIDGNKIKLNKCLAEEGQKQLIAGKLTKANIDAVAKDIATICATKLALNTNDTATVELATEVLKKIVK